VPRRPDGQSAAPPRPSPPAAAPLPSVAPSSGEIRVGAPFDACTVDLGHPSLADLDPALALDALLLSGTAAPIDRVFVGGQRRR
jgi:cytosine/adenosine deaminase-related metal-dependent hydrolase